MSPAPAAPRTMRVVLQIVEGPDLGRKMLLRSRHELKVGRTSWAEFVCEHDTKMSRIHFKVVTDSVGCYVEDLDSSNGTYLNGEKIANERLKQGDRIRAGLTTFLVQMEGDKPDLTGSYVGLGPAAAGGGSAKSKGPVLYGRKKCQSGLIQYSVAVEAVPPAALAEQLSKTWPLYLMGDFNRMGGVKPDDLTRADLLFDWLPPPVAAEYPVFFAQHDTAETPRLWAEFFGKDALVGIYSKANRGQILEHLRISARSRIHGDDDSPGMFGICWPSVIGQLLPNGDEPFVKRIISGIDAILVYRPDAPERGLIFGDEKVEKALKALGYELDPASVEQGAEPAKGEETGETGKS